MKKKWYMLFLILLFSIGILKVKAITSAYANDIIIDALKNNNWQVNQSSGNSDFFDITILIGTYSGSNSIHDEFLKDPPNSVIAAYLCDRKDCTYENYNEILPFYIKKKDGEVWLYSYNVNLNVYNSLKSYKYHTYEVITKQGCFLGSCSDEETSTDTTQFNPNRLQENFSSGGESGGDVGKNYNPLVIKTKETSVTIPDKNDAFWNDVSDNKCYYIKFDFSSKSDTPNARYKINPSDDAWNNIFWANDPTYHLATRLVADLYDNDVFQVSSANTYAICNSQGQTFTFEYKDAEQLNCSTTVQMQSVEAQNGKDSCKLNTASDIKSHQAQNGEFNPDNLCGRNNEYCNLDLTLFCTDAHVARTFKFLGILIALAKVLVPALIIGFGIMDIFKIVISGQEADAKKYAKNIFIRIVIGIVIFLLPTFLITIYNIAQGIAANGEAVSESTELAIPVDFQNCVNCILDIDKCDIES